MGDRLREVMDTGLRGPTDQDHVKSRFSTPEGHLSISRVTSAPEQRRPDEASLSSNDFMSRKRDSPMDRPYQRPVTETSSPVANPIWRLDSVGSRRPVDEPPDKRPRLDHVSDKEETLADSSMRRLDHYAVCMFPTASASPRQVELTAAERLDQSLCLPA